MESEVCKTGYKAVIDGLSQCRKAPRNVNENDLTRDRPDEKCSFYVYTKENFSDYDTPNVDDESSSSICGFNKVNYAYCPLQPGDEKAKRAIDKAYEQIRDFKCHQLSSYDGLYCADRINWQRSQDGWDYFLHGRYVGQVNARRSANWANNDECVADTINADLWQGHFEDRSEDLAQISK